MKKSFMFLLAFCGLIALLVVPGTASAYWVDLTTPTGWIPPANNTITVPNTGGSAGPEWGSYVWVDQHGDATPFFDQDAAHYTGYGWVNNGVVVLWQDASLPNALPSTLDGLLSSPDGYKANDLLIFVGGISRVFVVSEPSISLLPFKTSSDPLQQNLWNGISNLYAYDAKAIIANLPQTYTAYTPPNENWPGWDPSVLDAAYYSDTEKWYKVVNGVKVLDYEQPRYNPNYPPPSTWTQYTFYVANDRVQVPEPGLLLLFGFGLIALAAMRIDFQVQPEKQGHTWPCFFYDEFCQ